MEDKKDKTKKVKKEVKKLHIKSLNIDKAEYEEIILSNSNRPDSSFERYR